MKEGRHRLKDVTNVLQRSAKVDEIEEGYVVSDTELLVLDDVVAYGCTDSILDDYQIEILDEEDAVRGCKKAQASV